MADAGPLTEAVGQSEGLITPGALRICSAAGEEALRARTLQREAFALSDGIKPDHPGDAEDLRVCVSDGSLVSCLTILRASLCIRGARVPMGGIRHVATVPGERNRGFASALMRDSLRHMQREGIAASILFPFSFRYYRKFGYELGGNHCHFWSRLSSLPDYAERAACRPLTAGDCDRLADYYDRRSAQRACTLSRSAERWRSLCSDSRYRIVVCGDGRIDGYAITTEAQDPYGGRVLRVIELSSGSDSGRRALLGYLAGFQGESLEWQASAEDVTASGLLRTPAPLREGFKPRSIATVRPMFQFRVVDVRAALTARAPIFPEGSYRLALRIQDDLLEENNVPLAVQGTRSGAQVRTARAADPYFEADIRVFSQIYCGYLSPGEACSLGLCRASSPAAAELAEQLFPPGEPYLSELDRF